MIEKEIILEGATLHINQTDKFKTKVVSIKMVSELTRKNTTLRALLSMVLLGGTAKLNSLQALSTYLENMYGASFSTNVSTRGKAQILHLTTTFIDEQYLVEKEDLFSKQLQLMHDVLFSPNIENGAFKKEIVEMKKRELKDRLNAIKDDKYSYAQDRTFEIMGENDYLGISGIGYIEDLDSIDGQQLYDYLQESLKNDKIEIYAVGNYTESQISAFKHYFSFSTTPELKEVCYTFKSKRYSPIKVVEKQNITQAKLILGYTTDVDFLSTKHSAMTVFNGLFGGFSHSRLFKIVREKHSLCYFINSQYDAFNGICLVGCGIDGECSKSAIELINNQLEDIKNGNISDEEIEITKKMIINSLKKSQDETGTIIYLKFNRDLVGKKENLNQYMDELDSVSKKDIQDVAKMLKLDTCFLLEGDNDNGEI